VNGLAADAERRGDLRPRPAVEDGALDLADLEPVREPPQRDDGGEPLRGVARDGLFLGRYERHCRQP